MFVWEMYEWNFVSSVFCNEKNQCVTHTQRSLIRKNKNRYLDYDSIECTGDEEYFQIQYIIKFLLEVQKPICRNSASLFRTLLCIDTYLPAFYTSISGYKICVRLYLNGDGSVRGSHISILRDPYDSLLKCSFSHRVSLVNQDAFRPCCYFKSLYRNRIVSKPK
jgi:hypothetical protein